MIDPIDFDPALVGPWPPGGAVPVSHGAADPELEAMVETLRLETKAAAEPSPAEDLTALLNDMTAEMRRQFEIFRAIRVEAEAKLSGGGEAEQKVAKADVKAATDALSLIVRTIEKIDSLQRSLAHDRQAAAEQEFDQDAYERMLADIDRKIDARAEERMRAWLAEREGAGAGETGPPRSE